MTVASSPSHFRVAVLTETTTALVAKGRMDVSASDERKDWRDATIARVRRWIMQADPEAIEERKWKKPTNPDGVPVWSHDGIICTGEIYKNHVKFTFARGASLKDPSHLFNASLDGNRNRGIDVHEGEKLDEKAFTELIREAAALNQASRRRK